MPIQSSNPISVDGVEYPYLLVSLAVSPTVKPGGVVGASVALNLVPYRTVGNDIEKLPQHSKVLSYLDVFADSTTDGALSSSVQKIMEELQDFITSKGL